jgi:uncharacterized membrane protein YgcG
MGGSFSFIMKKNLFLFIILLILPLAMMAEDRKVDNGYTIKAWKHEAYIQNDNVWRVKDHMKVVFNESRHGIYFYIRTYFYRDNNINGGSARYNYSMIVDSINVESDNYTIDESNEGYVIVIIGDEDEYVSGDKEYNISYVLRVPDDRYDVSDYIYATVLPDDWNTSIGHFQFVLTFEKTLPEYLPQTLRVFSGPYGSIGNDLHIDVKADRKNITGSTVDVPPFNAITLFSEIDNGYWEDAFMVSNVWMYVFIALTAFFFVVVMYCFVRNRRRKPLTVIEYNAPDGISSAEVGVIIDSSADVSDLASLIVWFASKGYLKIREIPGKKHIFKKDEIDIELTKVKGLPKDAPKYQKKFWKVLFGDGNTVLLSELGDCHYEINEAINALKAEFTGKRALTTISWKTVCAILAFFICGSAAINCCNCVSAIDTGIAVFAMLFWGALAFAASIVRMWRSNYDMITSFWQKVLEYTAYIIVGVLDVAGFALFMYNEYDMFVPVEVPAGIMVAGWIIVLFSGHAVRDSKYRLEMMSLLLGFREFIEKSELPMLKSQVDENPSFFYDILPYAMVFGLTDKWAKKFSSLNIKEPDWYEGTGTLASSLLAAHISSAVASQIGNSISVSSHDTTSSSSGGGGFSGGGVGGGGGGSW